MKNIYKVRTKTWKQGQHWITEPDVAIPNGSFYYDGQDCYVVTEDALPLVSVGKEEAEAIVPAIKEAVGEVKDV